MVSGPDTSVAVPPWPVDSLALVKFQPPEIVFGTGALEEAGHAAGRLGVRRPFLVTDPGIVEAGWADELSAHLRDVGLSPVPCSDVSPDPKDAEVAAAHDLDAGTGSDAIIGTGGGSPMDAAEDVERILRAGL